jgi:hypothetical protein
MKGEFEESTMMKAFLVAKEQKENALSRSYFSKQTEKVYEEKKDFSTALTSYKKGLLISLQAGNQDHAGYNFRSLRRILPQLSPEEIESLKKDLPKEVFQYIMKEEKEEQPPDTGKKEG